MSNTTSPTTADSTMPIDKVLPRLHKLRQRQGGPSGGQWSACCPAHADGSPSLSVRETPDGAVLMHCFGGCTVAEVCAALGLELHELFPPRAGKPQTQRDTEAPQPKPPRLLSPSHALALLRTEALLVTVAAGNLARGTPLSDADRRRLLQAAPRGLAA